MINEDFEPKYPTLLGMVETELDNAKIIYDQKMQSEINKVAFGTNKNMPNVAGSLRWAQELRQRYRAPVASMKLSINPG